jgi:hypothetical protein
MTLLSRNLPPSLKAQSPFPGRLSILEPFLCISPFPPPSGALGNGREKNKSCSEDPGSRPRGSRLGINRDADSRVSLPPGQGPPAPSGRVMLEAQGSVASWRSLAHHLTLMLAQLPRWAWLASLPSKAALPPSLLSSRGWHQPHEPLAALAGVVLVSSPARRNSRHCG